MLGSLPGDVADRVVLVLVVQHGVGGRITGGDLFDAQQGIVGNIAGAAAGIGDSGRGVPGVLVPDDGALARQVDLREAVGGIPGVADGDACGIGKAFPCAVSVPGVCQTGVEGTEVYGLGELPSKRVSICGCPIYFEGLDDCAKFLPRDNPIHFLKKDFPARGLAVAFKAAFGKTGLAHAGLSRRVGSIFDIMPKLRINQSFLILETIGL